MAGTAFSPEEIEKLERERSREQAMGAHGHLGQAVGGFDFNRFVKEFANPLIEAYNAKARGSGLPPADRKWLRLLKTLEGHARKPKDFYVANRAVLQPRMFPGDPAKAAKAYDLFLTELSRMPVITSGPVSGILAHEFGHTQTHIGDPSAPIAAQRPSGAESGREEERFINEAVASYKGYQTAWKAWSRFGIPRKAWAAWYAFPTYTANLSDAQYASAMRKLNGMEAKYPGIVGQVRRVLQEYDQYVLPTLYNIPGKDWTAEEKKALQRFLRSRGGAYRETLPEDEGERLRHMKRQPYVMAPGTQPTSAVASAEPPFSKRALPLSKREGEKE